MIRSFSSFIHFVAQIRKYLNHIALPFGHPARYKKCRRKIVYIKQADYSRHGFPMAISTYRQRKVAIDVCRIFGHPERFAIHIERKGHVTAIPFRPLIRTLIDQLFYDFLFTDGQVKQLLGPSSLMRTSVPAINRTVPRSVLADGYSDYG